MTASEVRPQPRPCCLRLLAYLADYGRRRAPVARKPGTRQRGNRPDRPHAGQIPRGEYACAQMRGDVDAVSRACATGLRTNAISRIPGSRTSPIYWPRPCRKRSSSLRRSRAPIVFPLDVRSPRRE